MKVRENWPIVRPISVVLLSQRSDLWRGECFAIAIPLELGKVGKTGSYHSLQSLAAKGKANMIK